MSIYLDHAATSPLRPEAREAFLRVAEMGGNASSVHAIGRKAKIGLENARNDILSAVMALGQAGLVFTSGGTEANALALRQVDAFDYVVLSAGEHDSLYGARKDTVVAPLTPGGDIDIRALEALLDREGRPFVCAMLANNETGAVSDIPEVAKHVRARDGWLHVDAVQALGKMVVDFVGYGADSMSLSAHKVGGPQGVGALIYDRDRTLKPLISGSGQEYGLRAGTENLAGIAGFAAAVLAAGTGSDDLIMAQASVEDRLRRLGVTIMGEAPGRVGGILNIAQPHWPSSQQLIHMDLGGVCVSSGSACSSGKVKASRVIQAMGAPELADKALRISSGWTTTAEDWERFYAVWSSGYETYLERHGKAPVKEQA